MNILHDPNDHRHYANHLWRICLPLDWSDGEGSLEDTLYFESQDKSKGLYIGTLSCAGSDKTLDEVMNRIMRIGLQSMHAMEGSHWEVVQMEKTQSAGAHHWVVDCLDEHSQYRIVTKLIARPPLVISATFHDYLCEDLAASNRQLEAIIASLGFAEPS